VRASDYILEKRKELERVKRLEENVEIYFSKADVNQIIELIENGDLKAVNAAVHIVHVANVNSNNDLITVESVLKRVILVIIKEIFEKYRWLDKFLIATKLENIDFSDCDTLESFGKEFKQVIEKITYTISVLYYSNSGSKIVNSICNYVLENVDAQVSLSIVANKLFMNKTYISELFKQKTGIGFVEYIRNVKMERAKRLINEGNLKIYEIGEELGYKDIEYFSRQFKKYTGFTTIEFRQNSIKKEK
jgi:two-component system response regulator YesN